MTKNFCIIGNPIEHSLSPVLHNYWFRKYKIDAKYSILEIKENKLEEVVNKIKRKEIRINEKLLSHCIDLARCNPIQ